VKRSRVNRGSIEKHGFGQADLTGWNPSGTPFVIAGLVPRMTSKGLCLGNI
jgi:hypothetical protein